MAAFDVILAFELILVLDIVVVVGFVFERFSRNDESRSREKGGAGLGLAIAREIFEIHGGTVTIIEGTLTGASFEVRLPIAPDDRAQEAEPTD